MKKYQVPRKVFDRMLSILERDENKLQVLSEEIKEAKEYGDLSENATYDNLCTQQRALMSVHSKNERALDMIECVEDSEIANCDDNLFKTFTYVVTNMSQDIEIETKTSILIPPLDIGIENGVYITSRIGSSLSKLERKDAEAQIKLDDSIIQIKLLKVVAYDEGKIKFNGGENNSNGIDNNLDASV